MTKNIFILSLFIFLAFQGQAQCNPDNTIVKPGFYPSKLPDAVVGKAYNEVLNFKILKDTTVILFGNPTLAIVDSAAITDVIGMPSGMTFVLNKLSQTYTPQEVGCALVSGTPTKADTFKLKICLIIFAKISSFAVAQPDTLKNFSIIVKGTGSIPELANDSKLFYPNPLNNNTLTINPDRVFEGHILSIYNSLGQCLATHVFDPSNEKLAFEYPKGIYTIAINNGNSMSYSKLIKN